MNFINLKRKIINNKVTVGIIGLGYVGLPLSIKFTQKNIKVIGFDINREIIRKLSNGVFHLKTINKKFYNKKFKTHFFPSNDFSLIHKVDIIIICVPTPIKRNKKPNLGFLKNTLRNIKKY